MSRFLVAVMCTAVFLGLSATVYAISPTENDDFEDGTTMGWAEGVPSPNPPINVADGGPSGAGDNYLENASSGGAGGGSRMVMFNLAQWTGNYNAVGSALTISADMANLGGSALSMRLAVSGGGVQYASTNAVTIPADGVWYPVSFTFSDLEMTLVGGAGPLSGVLDNVVEMRILSASSPSWRGDAVAGTLGVDNLRVTQVPVEIQHFTVE